MPTRSTWVRALVSSAALSLCSCSLTTSNADACQSSTECRAAFGLGSACGSDGFCRPAESHARCNSAFPVNLLSDGAEFADAFVIGAIADESLDTHRARQDAVELAFTEARDQGGVEGRPVGVVFCTNEVDPTLDGLDQIEATQAITRFLIEQLAIQVVVGPPSSDATAAAFAIASERDTLVISPSATSPALSQLEPAGGDDPGLLWRTAPPDSLQGRVIADDLEMRGVSNVALIVQDGSYGNGLAEVFEANFSGTIERFSFATASARNAAAASAGSGSFDEVLFISSQTSDVSAFLLFAASFPGFAEKEVFLTDSAKNQDLLNDASSAASIFPRVRGSAPALPDGPTYETFVGSYNAAFGTDARAFSFTAHAYDAAWLTILGASWASLQESGTGGRDVARGLRRLSEGAVLMLGPSVLGPARERFRLGEAIDVVGASGGLQYDESEETRGPIEVWTIAGSGDRFDREYEILP